MRYILLICVAFSLRGWAQNMPAPDPPLDANPITETDKFAWQLFLKISRPVEGGVLSWETWTPASDVFNPPQKTPQDGSLASRPQFRLSKSVRDTLLATKTNAAKILAAAKPALCGPALDRKDQVMMNDETVKYILDNGLDTIEGQIAATQDGKKIDFPQESIEVKARWEVINEDETGKFYTRECGKDGKIHLGLVAFHITSKKTPNWIWATFEHVKSGEQDRNPDQCRFINCKDNFGETSPVGLKHDPSPQLLKQFVDSGVPENLRDIWKNYRLVGTQSDFIEGNTASHLGNSIVEKQFGATSSCITCHSRATIAENKTRLGLGPCKAASFDGIPEDCWFRDATNKTIYRQLDFVWSLMLARPKNKGGTIAPPTILNCQGIQENISQSH